MIRSVHIENFKCFKDFQIELGPFNVLIGPNDSGKTAFLQAVELASDVFAVQDIPSVNLQLLKQVFGLEIEEPIEWLGTHGRSMVVTISADEPSGVVSEMSVAYVSNQRAFVQGTLTRSPAVKVMTPDQDRRRTFTDAVGRVLLCRFAPDDLRAPSPMNPGGDRTFVMSSSGVGFPTFLEDLLREDREAFFRMERAFYERFPWYRLKPAKSGNHNILTFKSRWDVELPAKNVSDGALLYLAFLAVTHQPNPPKALLVEEPENGVHYARLKDIVTALRTVADERRAQVLITTHSPYLLDLVEPDDVRVFQKDEEGAVHASKMSDVKDVQDLKKHFMTGEIWTMETEAGLTGKARGSK